MCLLYLFVQTYAILFLSTGLQKQQVIHQREVEARHEHLQWFAPTSLTTIGKNLLRDRYHTSRSKEKSLSCLHTHQKTADLLLATRERASDVGLWNSDSLIEPIQRDQESVHDADRTWDYVGMIIGQIFGVRDTHVFAFIWLLHSIFWQDTCLYRVCDDMPSCFHKNAKTYSISSVM